MSRMWRISVIPAFDAGDNPDRSVGEKCGGLRPADDREAAWLVEVGRDLGQELVGRQPHRDGDPHRLLDAPGEAGEGERGARVVEALRAREIEEGLIDGDRLHERRELQHQPAHLAASHPVLVDIGPQHHSIGTGLERLEHRHGRVHPIGAGDIAGGGDDAPLGAADDEGLVEQARVVALLDRGKEGIAIDMRD
jgi:hypothetical protein